MPCLAQREAGMGRGIAVRFVRRTDQKWAAMWPSQASLRHGPSQRQLQQEADLAAAMLVCVADVG